MYNEQKSGTVKTVLIINYQEVYIYVSFSKRNVG